MEHDTPTNKTCPFCGRPVGKSTVCNGRKGWYYCHHACFEKCLHNDDLYEFMDKYEGMNDGTTNN